MEIAPFPNSVNVPYHGIDQLRDSYRIDQISRNTTKEIAANSLQRTCIRVP
jgi:hypothetical protein